MIICRLRQLTLSPPFTQKGYQNYFQLQGYHNLPTRLKVPHKDLLSNVQGHMSITHTRLRVFIILIQQVLFTLYMYQVRDTSIKQETHILYHTIHIAYRSREPRDNQVNYSSPYTLL